MKRKQRLWLTKNGSPDSGNWSYNIVLWRVKPRFDKEDAHWWCKTWVPVYYFCEEDFTRITGISLKPGEIREVESITIKLKK